MNRKIRIQPIDTGNKVDDNGYDRVEIATEREMHALQELGQALIELPKDALKRMPMPEARRITDHESKRRQLQYVGKVMRSLTEDEVAALRTALDTHRGVNKSETARLHWIERTREQLLDKDEALTDFIQKHPGVDAQEGRTLIRNARKERQQQKPPRYYRELFQWIKNAAGMTNEESNEDIEGDEDDRETTTRKHPDELVVGLVSISNSALQGVYEDKGVRRCRNDTAPHSPRRVARKRA